MQSISKLIPRKRVHFVGIGGVGMSALAQILLEQGYRVSGSDVKESLITKRLFDSGAKIFLGHKAENVSDDADIIVYSSCILPANPELTAAKKKKIKLVKRGLLLSMLMNDKTGIAITGAHGKTTTTSLIAFLLKNAELDPTFAVGAEVNDLKGNAQFGKSQYFVAEADESDASFLYLKPKYEVITNIDKEHLDYYRNLSQIIKAFRRFIFNIQKNGVLFCYGEDKFMPQALRGYKGKYVTYGFKKGLDIYATDIYCEGMFSEFNCIYKGEFLDRFSLKIPGLHNVLNALACIGIGHELNINKEVIKATLSNFHGASRRFQIKSTLTDILIVDDYAHHPTEIMATLKAAKTWKNRRLIGVFQPHRYSRTKFLKEEFGRCFSLADHLVITDIYPAFESPIKGVGAETIYEQVKKSGHRDVHLLPKEKISEHLINIIKEGDLLMMLGAGDINKLVDEIVEKLSERQIPVQK